MQKGKNNTKTQKALRPCIRISKEWNIIADLSTSSSERLPERIPIRFSITNNRIETYYMRIYHVSMLLLVTENRIGIRLGCPRNWFPWSQFARYRGLWSNSIFDFTCDTGNRLATANIDCFSWYEFRGSFLKKKLCVIRVLPIDGQHWHAV